MELEELKKSWNALDEHLKDKKLIKEEELSKLIGHADKGIHVIANLNIKLILISLPVLILFLAEVLLHNRLNPIYHHSSCLDSGTLLGHRHHPFSPTDSNRRNAACGSDWPRQPHPSVDYQGTVVCHCLSSDTGCTFVYLLASMAIWNRYDALFLFVMGWRTWLDPMDLP